MNSLRSINLNLLPVLHELLIQVNVTKAAEALFLSQSATSEALGRLRILFDDPLLVKEGRTMYLTPFAKELIPQVKDAYQAMEHVFSEATFDAKGSQRKFLITTADITPFLLGSALSQLLAEQAPNIEVQFLPIEVNNQGQLEVGVVDFAICPEGFLQTKNLHSSFVFESEMVGIASKNNDRAYDGMTVEEYSCLRHVTFSPGNSRWDTMESRALAAHGLSQHNVISLPYFSTQAFVVAGTDSVALVHRQEAEMFADLLDLKVFTPPVEIPKIPVLMYWGAFAERDPAHRWMRTAIESIVDSL